MIRFFRELLFEILGEFAFWVISVVWCLACIVGFGFLGAWIGLMPNYGVYVGLGIGVAVPFVWWVRRQIAEQRRLAE